VSDPQKIRVYVAEAVLTPARPNLTTSQAQDYVVKILKTPTWKRFTPNSTGVAVRRLRAGAMFSQAETNNLIISLAPRHHNRISVAHEMAHILTGRLFGHRVENHGPEYVWILRCLLKDIRTHRDFLRWEKGIFDLSVRWNRDVVEVKARLA